MTSPDLINELKASRPGRATGALRARVREISARSHPLRPGGLLGRSWGAPCSASPSLPLSLSLS